MSLKKAASFLSAIYSNLFGYRNDIMRTMANDTVWKKFIKSLPIIGAIVTVATAIVSLSMYIYEINFCNYFHIPTDWISISGVRSVQCTPLVVALIVPIFIARKPSLKYITGGIVLVAILFYISFLTGVITSWDVAIFFIIALFIIPMLQYITYSLYSRLRRRHPTDFQERYKRTTVRILGIQTFFICLFWLLKQMPYTKMPINTLLLSIGTAVLFSAWVNYYYMCCEDRFLWITSRLNHHARWLEFKMLLRERRLWNIVGYCCIVVILAFLIPYSYAVLGRGEAELGKFSVLASNQSIVVLRIYGDKAVCAPVKNESGNYTIIEEFFTLPSDNISLMPTQIGPLKTSN